MIPNLSENESATFELHLAKDGAVELSSFTRNGTEIENDGFVKGNLNDSIQSPLGPIVVIPSAAYSDKTVSTIYVTRQSLSAASAGVISAVSCTVSPAFTVGDSGEIDTVFTGLGPLILPRTPSSSGYALN